MTLSCVLKILLGRLKIGMFNFVFIKINGHIRLCSSLSHIFLEYSKIFITSGMFYSVLIKIYSHEIVESHIWSRSSLFSLTTVKSA